MVSVIDSSLEYILFERRHFFGFHFGFEFRHLTDLREFLNIKIVFYCFKYSCYNCLCEKYYR